MDDSTSLDDPHSADASLAGRIASNPRPALLWGGVLAVLLLMEGSTYLTWLFQGLEALINIAPGSPGADLAGSIVAWAKDVPNLLSRELLPNRGHYTGSGYEGTVFGLEPKYAWLLRFLVTYAYAFTLALWIWFGYVVYRRHYRMADWTPTDDMIDRLRGHSWGQFGLIVVFLFVVMAMWAPVVGPTTFEQNIKDPYADDHRIDYWDEESGSVESIYAGDANVASASKGGGAAGNVGPWTYDDYGRFHPFGTDTAGQDLFTFLAYGARISLLIGLGSMGLAGFIAMFFSLLTAYYKGLTDLAVVLAGDSIQALPRLLLLILAAVVFQGTWLAQLYDGAVLLIVLFAVTGWPGLWRALRGPALQVSEEEWIDAAKSYGQRPLAIMRKHMAPYIVGYLLIYASLSLAGVIIGVAGLSFLGLGIDPPTPEWGQAVNNGRTYASGPSWHIALIPGILVTLIAIGFNALGDGIRDAIDPESDASKGSDEVAAGGSAA
jgi:peptide/nickel transport system permease protein